MQQFRQLGFKFKDRLFDGLALQLLEMETELFREQGFDMRFDPRQKLLYFILGQQTRQIGVGFINYLGEHG